MPSVKKNIPNKTQLGVALITALLVLALATTAAVFLTTQNQMSLRRTGNIITSNQAELYAYGGEGLAVIVLNKDIKENQIDCNNDLWAFDAPPFPVDGGFIQGKITDLQSLFNINNLVSASTPTPAGDNNNNDNQERDNGVDGSEQPQQGNNPNNPNNPLTLNTTARARFIRLLEQYDVDHSEAEGLTDALTDWLDADINPSGINGAEDDYYAGLDHPYRAANGPMTSVSELRMVRGFSEIKRFDELVQNLTVLPERTPINVNTASREILIALSLDPADAEYIAGRTGNWVDPELADSTDGAAKRTPPRQNSQDGDQEKPEEYECFDSVEAFKASTNASTTEAGEDFRTDDLSVTSSYFLYTGTAQIDRGQALLKSVLHRDNSGLINVVTRSQTEL